MSGLRQHLPADREDAEPTGGEDHRADRKASEARDHTDGMGHTEPEERDAGRDGDAGGNASDMRDDDDDGEREQLFNQVQMGPVRAVDMS